jgi:hypothetical protein
VSVHVAENPAEGTQAVPARLQRNLEDRQRRIAKQGLRPFEPAGKQVTMGREAECMLEGSREVRLGYMAYLC